MDISKLIRGGFSTRQAKTIEAASVVLDEQDGYVGFDSATGELPGDYFLSIGQDEVVAPLSSASSYVPGFLQVNADGTAVALCDFVMAGITAEIDFDDALPVRTPEIALRLLKTGGSYPDDVQQLGPFAGPGAQNADSADWKVSFATALSGTVLTLKRGDRFWLTVTPDDVGTPAYSAHIRFTSPMHVGAAPVPIDMTAKLLTATPQFGIELAPAKAQPTVIGREIHSLAVLLDGRVYAAYGDYDTNTGPIEVLSVDPSNPTAGARSEITLATEETWVFREYGDDLYVPFVDPAEHDTDHPQGIYARRRAGVWTVQSPITPIPTHAMDMLKVGNRLYLSGAVNGDTGAAVWESGDDGVTWTQTLTNGGANSRYYALAALPGDYVMAAISGDNQMYLRHPDTGAWTYEPIQVGDSLFVSDFVPFVYQGKTLAVGISSGKMSGARYNGTVHAYSLQADNTERSALAIALGWRTLQANIAVSPDQSRLWLYDGYSLRSIGSNEPHLSEHRAPRFPGTAITVSDTHMYIAGRDSVVRGYLLSDLPVVLVLDS